MRFVTKAIPINNIDSRCHIKKPEGSMAYMAGYSGFISHELFLMAGGGGTGSHTCHRLHGGNFGGPGVRRLTGQCVPGVKTRSITTDLVHFKMNT